jgi:hypothetical protein
MQSQVERGRSLEHRSSPKPKEFLSVWPQYNSSSAIMISALKKKAEFSTETLLPNRLLHLAIIED